MKIELLEDGFIATGRGHLRPIVVTGPTQKMARQQWIEVAAEQQREQIAREMDLCPVCLQKAQAHDCGP